MLKEKIVILNFDIQNAHFIAKQVRTLGYYSEICFPNIDISELQNVKGIILSPISDTKNNSTNTEFNQNILSLEIPILDLRQEKKFIEKYSDTSLLKDFIEKCKIQKNWNLDIILANIIQQIQFEIGNKNALVFLSGGIKSTVIFALLNKALGKERVLGLHIDNGFMRKNESNLIVQKYIDYGFSNFILEDKSQNFLSAIEKIINAEEKKQIIYQKFLEIYNEILKEQNLLEKEWILAQSFLYNDIIENGQTKNTHGIKINPNKILGVQTLLSKGLIINPLKDLYLCEVKLLAKKLELPEELFTTHPFAREGLSANVLCSNEVLTSQEERELKKANQKLSELDLSENIKSDSYLLKALPIKSTGIQTDFKEYKFTASLYLNNKKIPDWEILEKASSFITNSVEDVNRIIYCIYEKENCVLQEQFCTKKRLDQTREVDEIVIDELKENNWYSKISQHLTINLPYATSKEKCSIVLRPVISEDGTTAKFAKIPLEILEKIIEKISKLDFVDGLYFDITNKPPSKITWE